MGNIISSIESDELVINYQLNEPIKNIPERIKKIKFHSNCTGKLQISLKNNLTVESIYLSKLNTHIESLENLPCMLKHLYLNNIYYKKINNFPCNLEILECTYEFFFRQINIPNTLKKLAIKNSFVVPNDSFILKQISLPEYLEELYFQYESDYEPNYSNHLIKLFENLPNTLKVLRIPGFWNNALINLPSQLEKLYIGIKYNQTLDFLPESIKYIEFIEQCIFDKPLNNLPSKLEYINLQFQNEYINTISNLPDSIKYLELGEYELEIGKLPSKLVELIIASPVKFNYFKYGVINLPNGLLKQTNFYELKSIGKYNIENNIMIKIPADLSTIKYWDGHSSVYEYKKCSNSHLWYKVMNEFDI